MTEPTRTPQTSSHRRHQAGWFDIRNVIGLLLLIYGIVLIVRGLFVSDSDLAKAHTFNANLWTGLCVTAGGAFFVIWSKMRPTVVDDAQVQRDREAQENEPPAH